MSERDRHFIAAGTVIARRLLGGFRVFNHAALEQELVAMLHVALVHGSTAVLVGYVHALRA